MATICKAIFEEICVLANGEVVCSCGDPAGLKVYGSVYEQSIKDIFSCKEYRQMRSYQLCGSPSSYCPVIGCNCGGRVYPSLEIHKEEGLSIKRLQLEPISFCNLDCPECPVHFFESDNNYRRNRNGRLSLETMIDLIKQLPNLEILWFYNFGEPFLHPDAVEFLRAVRKLRPNVEIQCSTNGIPLSKQKITDLVQERLVDHIVFSIDGVDQESYGKYRRRGSFEKAFANMLFMKSEIVRCGMESEINLRWQYILFDWNDDDVTLEKAKALSVKHKIPVKWVLTHTEGRSTRYTQESPEYRNLVGSERFYENLTCELQVVDLLQNGSKGAYYAADLKIGHDFVSRQRMHFDLMVTNRSRNMWGNEGNHRFRIGVYVMDQNGKHIKELPGALFEAPVTPGEQREIKIRRDIDIPREGQYLLIDVVHEHVCWFHQRGSTPVLVKVKV